MSATPPTPNTSMEGEFLGPYLLLRLLGEGGFARVWAARQTEPLVRDVAVKVLKPGMGSAEVLRRFQVEQETLAQMDHPGIARVLGAGSSGTGMPYIAMELVAGGEPITEHCRKNELSCEARLHLFLQLCSAVEHAHQLGVIHRDLKPGNVLVADGRVKVIDFGIAKAATEERDGTMTFELGTPGYASPEQQRDARDVDIRGDVFSLGVLLQEMLHGLPRSADLTWVVRRCLEPEREDRYPTVDALAGDVRRHLEHRPVLARPSGFIYPATRFIRRHHGPVVAACLALGILATGVVIALQQARDARMLRAQSEALSRVLIASWRGASSDPEKNPTLISMLRQVVATVGAPDFQGRPQARCRVLLEASEAAGQQFDYQLAYEAARHAERLISENPSLGDDLRFQAWMCLGNSILHHESAAKAVPVLRRAWELGVAFAGPGAPATLTAHRTLGGAMVQAKDPAAAKTLRNMLAEGRAHQLPADHVDMLTASLDLASLVFQQGREDEGLRMLEQTLADARVGGAMKRNLVVRILLRRGVLLTQVRRHGEAIPAFEAAEAEARKASPPDTAMVILLRSNRALSYTATERTEEAATLLKEVFEEQVRFYGITKRHARTTALRLASAYVKLQRWAELDRLLYRVLASVGPGLAYPYHAQHVEALAKHYDSTGKTAEATAWRERGEKAAKKGKAGAP